MKTVPEPSHLNPDRGLPQPDDALLEAKKVALRRLNRRECSTGDLAQVLKRKGFAPEIIAQVVHDLVQIGYVDDVKYTRMVVREQALRGKGPQWIRMKLKEKGITSELEGIGTLMREVADCSELAVARGVVARRYSHAKEDPGVARKALQALMRRGFSYDIAREALKSFDQGD